MKANRRNCWWCNGFLW